LAKNSRTVRRSPIRRFSQEKPEVLALTGASSSGKTTACRRIVDHARANGLQVAGLLTPSGRSADGDKVSLEVEDIKTGERRPLAERTATPEGPKTENWRFHAEGLAWGNDILLHATPADLLLIDELGPLELLRGGGWTSAIEVLRAGAYRLALVVVRPALLPALEKHFPTRIGRTFLLHESDRHSAIRDILAIVEADS
jgi:nucleoside-triphosphatase THEP1